MKPIKDRLLDGPIPGEALTSDTRNQPWHKPPEYTDIDEAVEFIIRRIVNKQRGHRIITAAELGIPLTTIADTILTVGMMNGKWTPDFALLLAGPTVHIIKIMCDAYEIPYRIGIEENETVRTGEFFKAKTRLKRGEDFAEAEQAVEAEQSKIKDATSFLAGIDGVE